ncbi:MAG: complex I subunit 5 family protein [Tepidisphaeraceae bacterium]
MHTWLPILPIVIPLLVAAVLAGGDSLLPRLATDILSTAAVLGVLGLTVWLCAITADQPVVYWLGGWRPQAQSHFPVGICLVIDPVAAGMASLVSVLTLGGMVFSWRYFKSVQSYSHAILLVFMAAMIGMCLSGDIFNLFVFFELMTACGVTLCGYKSKSAGSLQGALNFGVVNALGAFITLMGVGLLYAYTGTLNMAEAGRTLAAHPPGQVFLMFAMLLTFSGFLIKSAAVPFHFWLADAHAVAPTPVSVLFSGVMVELGLYAMFRLYFGVFAETVAVHAHGVQVLFLAIGAVTTTLGGVYCFGQRHLKRMLAFSTVSHIGAMYLGFAVLSAGSVGGMGVYLLGHGLLKGALFLCSGVLLHHFGTVDEFELQGRCQRVYPTMAVMGLAALGLAGMPPFATALGASMIHHAAESAGLGWVSIFMAISGALTGGGVVRAGLRLVSGLGERQSPATEGAPTIPEEKETHPGGGGGASDPTPLTMWLPGAVMVLLAMGLAVYPPARTAVAGDVERIMETHLFQQTVLRGTPARHVGSIKAESLNLSEPIVVLTLAILLVVWALWPRLVPRSVAGAIGRIGRPGLRGLRALQSGRVGDYVAFLVAGLALCAGLLLL